MRLRWQGMNTNDYVVIGLLVIGTSFLAEIPISKWRSRKKAKDASKPARPLGKPSPEQPGSSARTGPEQETQGKVQEDASPPPHPVSDTWLKPKKAYMLIRTSALVAPLRASLEDMENPDWEDIQGKPRPMRKRQGTWETSRWSAPPLFVTVNTISMRFVGGSVRRSKNVTRPPTPDR